MNLVEKLKQEVTELNLTNKLDIAKYIYKRTGQIFEYEPNWFFGSIEEREELKSKQIDIKNVNDTDKYITCFSWTKMYNELLQEFGIDSRIKYIQESIFNPKTGAYFLNSKYSNVEVLIDDKPYIADLTRNLNDMVAIKFGLNTKYNCEPLNGDIEYKQPTKQEATISRIKEMLEFIKEKENLNDEAYIFQAYRAIENNIDLSKLNVGFIEGKAYVDSILENIISKDYKSYNVCFYDKENKRYMSVYIVPLNGKNHFFSCEKQNSGLYKFNEVPKDRIDFYFENYKYKLSENLRQMASLNINTEERLVENKNR